MIINNTIEKYVDKNWYGFFPIMTLSNAGTARKVELFSPTGDTNFTIMNGQKFILIRSIDNTNYKWNSLPDEIIIVNANDKTPYPIKNIEQSSFKIRDEISSLQLMFYNGAWYIVSEELLGVIPVSRGGTGQIDFNDNPGTTGYKAGHFASSLPETFEVGTFVMVYE